MDDYPLLNVFWTMLWFFLWILWFFLLFRIVADIFRSHDLGGLAKTVWLIFVIVLPFLGVFIYLIARGGSMSAREVKEGREREEQFRSYVRESAGTSSHADELTKLAALKDKGDINEDEYQRAKAKILA